MESSGETQECFFCGVSYTDVCDLCVYPEEEGGGEGRQGEPGNFEAGSDSGSNVPKVELGIRETEVLEENEVFQAIFRDGSEAIGFPMRSWNKLLKIKTELEDNTSKKQEGEKFENGDFEGEEEGRESEPNRVTLIVKTYSEPGSGTPATKSRTFKMVVKSGCSLAKVKESMSKTLNVPVQRILLKKNRTRGIINDSSCLVQEFHDCVIFACLL